MNKFSIWFRIFAVFSFTPMIISGPTATKNQTVLNLFMHEFDGEGTYYGQTTGGTCSYGPRQPPELWKVDYTLIALNRPQFMNSMTCGLCLVAKGDGKGLGLDPIVGEFLVFTKDLCPECVEGDIDIALTKDGRWDISIQAVQCPVGSTTIQYSFQGSNPWYLKLQVRNARVPITQLLVREGATWASASHTTDGYWLKSSREGKFNGPIEVQLTSANGYVLRDTITGGIESDSSAIVDGASRVQVPLDSSLPVVGGRRVTMVTTAAPGTAGIPVTNAPVETPPATTGEASRGSRAGVLQANLAAVTLAVLVAELRRLFRF